MNKKIIGIGMFVIFICLSYIIGFYAFFILLFFLFEIVKIHPKENNNLIIRPLLKIRPRRYIDYEVYLLSDIWKNKRIHILARDEHTCQYCFSIEAIEVHHITYERLGNEKNEDLICLCRTCHKKLHKLAGKNAKYYPISILKGK